MKAWKVGNNVGNTRNKFPDLLEPIETDKPLNRSLFPAAEES